MIAGILRRRRLVQRGFGLEVADAEGDAAVLEAVPQHVHKAVHVDGVVQRRAELAHGVHLVRVRKPRPRLGLGALDEADQRVREQAPLRVVHIRVAGIAALGRPEERGDVVFKALFGGNHILSPFESGFLENSL